MAVMVVHRTPTLTRERYEEVVLGLGDGDRERGLAVDGMLVHVAGEGPDGFVIVDVFASQEAYDRFAERVGPIARAAGIAEPPVSFPAHTFTTG